MNRDAIIGCILGTAIGDALGLPYEGVSPQRAPRLLGPPDRFRFFFGRDAIGAEGCELSDLLRKAVESVRAVEGTAAFAGSMGLAKGVTGYTYHTMPVAIHAWLSHPNDFRQAVTTMIECGGDADTTAAIAGGIVGAGVGRAGIPAEWMDGIWEWPRSVAWMSALGESLADSLSGQPATMIKTPSINPVGVLLRNLLFLFVVLFHGFRRLAPPY
ncbi:ADP-ribosylglycohydrolase [Rubripirellula lacrimiformis]|uniref:ADP-ribosylglycohydrolase n=1 Tax=Rubripirellula lacrimiformis TaxID=1930273 RepID=A0A517NJE2_9BACT|nr:ADP-ribosylglycohydrolase family protein [Rubripirellula lacrimiformis]QDT07237.1 ADP-ribosylglycohydrolase [Rubripirellula lacrimiformis]